MPAPPEAEGGVVVRHAPDHIFRRVDAIEESPQPEEAPRQQQLAAQASATETKPARHRIEQTLSHTTIRFQNPIMLSSATLSPPQARVSLMATTYMKCRISSIVNSVPTKRVA